MKTHIDVLFMSVKAKAMVVLVKRHATLLPQILQSSIQVVKYIAMEYEELHHFLKTTRHLHAHSPAKKYKKLLILQIKAAIFFTVGPSFYKDNIFLFTNSFLKYHCTYNSSLSFINHFQQDLFTLI